MEFSARYSWPEGSAESSLGPSNFVEFDEDWRSPEYSAFHECSGRVVAEAGDEVVGYDFAKFILRGCEFM